jgi:methionyl-tRNA formyltransferase
MVRTRILFMGTPQFAVPALAKLIEHNDHYTVVAVITQPDAPAGRGKHLTQSPVKQIALSAGLPVLQPETLKPPEVVEHLRSFAPDCIVVAAFGQILRKPVLEMPRYGCINVHGSLLPRWRGASPVSAAIAAGDATTGVTIMQMGVGLDNGPMLSKREELIRPDDTAGSLMERLSHIGADLLIETLPKYFSGEIKPEVQDERLVTLCRQLKKEEGAIDWHKCAIDIERHVRAMQPWPGAFTDVNGKRLKILSTRPSALGTQSSPGTISIHKNSVQVQCGEGALELLEVQPEGKKAMPAADFARGQPQLKRTEGL